MDHETKDMAQKNLASQHCEACRADAPTVSDTELTGLLQAIPDWTPVVHDNILQLQRIFACKPYGKAVAFAGNVAALAEQEGHHPAILIEWGSVTVTWWSHKIRGLHKNDFVMAAKTDVAFSQI